MTDRLSPAQYNSIAALAVTAYGGLRFILNVIWHVRHRYFFVDFQKIEYEKKSATVADMKRDIWDIFVNRNLSRNEAWKKCKLEIPMKYDLVIKKYDFKEDVICNPPYDGSTKNNSADKSGCFLPMTR